MSAPQLFRLPDVGEGLTEAEIVKWHVGPGDRVEVNQTIVEIETAKAIVELPCPFDGVVDELLADEGTVVDVGSPIIAVVDESSSSAASATAPGTPDSTTGAASASGDAAAGDADSAPDGASGGAAARAAASAGTAASGDADSAPDIATGDTAAAAAAGGSLDVAAGGPVGAAAGGSVDAAPPEPTPAERMPADLAAPGPAEEQPAQPESLKEDLVPGAPPDGPKRQPVLVGYGVKPGATKRRPRKAGHVPAQPRPQAVDGASARAALATPPVRKMARDLGVDLTALRGTGPNGSITRDDIRTAAGALPGASPTAPTAAPGPPGTAPGSATTAGAAEPSTASTHGPAASAPPGAATSTASAHESTPATRGSAAETGAHGAGAAMPGAGGSAAAAAGVRGAGVAGEREAATAAGGHGSAASAGGREAAVAGGGAGVAGAVAAEVAAPEAAAAPARTAEESAGGGERVPVRGVRRAMAAAMVESAFTAPHVTEFLQVDVTETMDTVARLRALPDFADVKVSPLLLVAKALVAAVRRHPHANASYAGDHIAVHSSVNLGIAAATDRGLIVPNIKDAQALSLVGLARALGDLTARARAGKCSPADLTGGTITITNVGVFGVDAGTPILTPGEAAILAFGQIRDLPWVHEGELAIRKVTTLALSFDHRALDGAEGSAVLRDVGAMLADPLTLLAHS